MIRSRKQKEKEKNQQVMTHRDEQNHANWLAICLEEIRDGNQKGCNIRCTGICELNEKVQRMNCLRYTRAQFKNHWDSICRDWQAWTALERETGLGFDGKTIVQDDGWWKLFAKRYPEAKKFKDGHVLLHRDKLDLLFKGNAATGKYIFVSRSSVNEDSTTCQQEEIEFKEVEGVATTPINIDEPEPTSVAAKSNKRKCKKYN